MKERKHIDELFKERFDGFEATPPADTWDQIASKLPKKKKERRIIPIWWRAAGVAALLALLFTIGNSVFGPSDAADKLSEEETKPVQTEAVQDNSFPEDTTSKDIQLADDSDGVKVPDASDEKADKAEGKAGNAIYDKQEIDEAVAREDVEDQVQKLDRIKTDKVDISPLIKDDSKIVSETKKEAVAANEKTGIPANRADKTVDEKKPDEGIARKVDKVNDMIMKEKAVSAKVDTDVAKADAPEEKKAEDPQEQKKRSIFDAIEEEKEEEAVALKNSTDGRWEVTPNAGPVYYSSLGNGSSIDPSFADNSQSGDVNFSYGANISYAISEKLSVRTGISNVNLSYTTGDVELGTGPVSSALRTVDYGGRQIVTTAVDKGALQPGNPEGGPFDNIVPKSGAEDAFINQSLRYYEVPLELKYSFFKRKFGMHLIGGFSSLFLADNEISVESGDFSTVLGEANNLNSLSFTTNIGLGFDYKIGKRLKFNIEPMFKYQLNPYTDSSVDFNPFYMGVYTGLSFKF